MIILIILRILALELIGYTFCKSNYNIRFIEPFTPAPRKRYLLCS